MIQPITDPAIIEGYLSDASNIKGHADGLLRPRSTQEVAAIVHHCQTHRIPLTVSAGRTSTTAAPVPFGGLILSLERLNRVLAINHKTACAQGGVFLGAFQREIEATGRFFPPDPTSRHECTLGGAIACNASGARSFRYGPTRPWIEAIEVVLPTGAVLRVKRGQPVPSDWPIPQWVEPAVKTTAGYAPSTDLIDVFIGQEGTLGVITEATVRLTKAPSDVLGFFLFFESRALAFDWMREARHLVRIHPDADFSPRCIEYFDHACLKLGERMLDAPPQTARAGLFCEQEVQTEHDPHLEAWWSRLEALPLGEHSIVAFDRASREQLLSLRHAIPAGINEQVVANQMPKISTDLAVPDDALDTMAEAYEAAPVTAYLFGHLGDNHLHLNLLPTNADELILAKDYYLKLARLAIQHHGTISAEHGVGKIKKEPLTLMVGPTVLAEFIQLKRHLDPNGVLGRGTLFDLD